jgi:hypothetical protein
LPVAALKPQAAATDIKPRPREWTPSFRMSQIVAMVFDEIAYFADG